MLTPSIALPALGGASRRPEPSRRTGDAPAVRPRRRMRKRVRENQDRHVVVLMIAAFGLLVMAIASIQMSGNLRASGIETALSGTLTSVAQHQADFRAMHQRFGRWEELQERGLRLPPHQRLVKSNASDSHWFVAIRDMETGMVCERTGELFDESPDERTANCRPLN